MTQPRLLGGRYELDGVIGRGGMAEVYRARDLRLDRIVAVKTLRSDLARDPTFQARFSREAQSAASLNHPSVIAVYDTGEDRIGDTPVPYIVMEYVDGHTLRDLLRENRRLRPERAMEITDGILRALDYSHRGQIIHRDIKPANVMLTRNHEVKVMDFGIARAMDDSAATMTQTAQVIGTAQYLSPEQARGERVDARSDLYSTGCVLYELLTGRPPFTGDSPVSIAYQHVREEPIPPSQIDHEIPQWLDAIVLKAMAKDPNQRYQSATEFRADLQRALQGMPVSATAASTMMMGAAPAGTQVMGQVPGGPGRTQMHRPAATDYGLPPVRYDDYDDLDGREGKGRQAAIWVAVAAAFIGLAVLAAFLLTNGGDNPDETVQVAVPAVIGTSQQEAEQALTTAGLKVGEVTEEYSDDVAKGDVISTNPEEAKQVDKGTEVALVVSKGKQPAEQVEVPSVEGKSATSAAAELTAAGFRVSTRQEPSNDVPRGQAIKTTPSAGSKVDKGSRVTLYVSAGPNEVQVPDVSNSTGTAACNRIRALGLRCRLEERPPEGDVPDGLVIGTNPGAGTTMSRGETVTVFVAKRPQQPPPPGTPTGPGGPGGFPHFGDD
ncbi:Stk1 family PASTA domain-containing Ser/Thr kinase [Actinomadura craniellae]|uniref:non-specific serine/threonine protein kinase n=1 Tax=Actinomadura craniellae TaxID=2231787 RepID=A0A365H6L5_9ACTN|nr:Stk1 family PASTA domain-containing Ser/Thr kinase [Actinomadura craniellae]RAY14642.1 Stk1 family PASTA domain-containing Ser/Thr kinase [Actinomadura craniellae]